MMFQQVLCRWFLYMIMRRIMSAPVSLRVLSGSWTLLSLWWLCDFGASSILDAVNLKTTTWLLFSRAFCMVFPLGGILCKLSSRQIKPFSITCELCCWTMLYMLTIHCCLVFLDWLVTVGNQATYQVVKLAVVLEA